MIHTTDFTTKPTRSAVTQFAQKRHKVAARVVGFGLVANSAETWGNVSKVLSLRLTAEELAMMATATLGAMPPETAEALMLALLADDGAGPPIAPLFGLMDQAGFWADLATDAELKAYSLACFTRLSPSDKTAFLGYIGGAS